MKKDNVTEMTNFDLKLADKLLVEISELIDELAFVCGERYNHKIHAAKEVIENQLEIFLMHIEDSMGNDIAYSSMSEIKGDRN